MINNIRSLPSPGPQPPSAAPSASTARSLSKAVSPSDARQKLAAQTKLGRPNSSADPALIRQTASQLVSQLFFQPMLAEMRKLPFGGEIGQGGRGEEVFGEQLDQRVADAVADTTAGSLKQTIEQALSNSETADALPTRATPPSGPIAEKATWPTFESLRRELRQQAVSAFGTLAQRLSTLADGSPASGSANPSMPAAGDGVSP